MEAIGTRRLVHLSDLHFGAGARLEHRMALLVDELVERRVDHVVVTGDVTEHGTVAEFDRFCRVFEPLFARRRLTVVPGNHDRLGDDVAELTMGGRRVRVERPPGLHLVLVDSTRPNPGGFAFVAHGRLDLDDLAEIEAALATAESDRLVCVLLHHHPTALPHESWLEALGQRVGLPFGSELDRGDTLVDLARGRADLVLHGHRHRPRGAWLHGVRPLGIFNAGCSSELGHGREFVHRDGVIIGGPGRWGAARSATQPMTSAMRPPVCDRSISESSADWM